MEDSLAITQEVMIRFLLHLPSPEQETISQEVQHIFIKDLNRLKALYQTPDQGDKGAEEKDVHRIVNGDKIVETRMKRM